MNPANLEIGNAEATEGRDIPWLQDVDEDGDGESDNWLTSWPFTYRDVVIVDANSVAVDTFNLTVKSLEEPDSYATLRQMLIDVAESTVAPQDDSISIAIDGSFEIDVLANDGGESRLQVSDVGEPAHGSVEIVVREYPADLAPIETFMPELVISEIVPGEYVELFNVTYAELELSSAQHVLVSGDHAVEVASLGQGQAIGRRDYLQLPWPTPITVSSESGEMVLFRDGLTGFHDARKIDDFVVWGTEVAGSRIELAKSVNKWWGPPDGSLDIAAIQRIPGTRGDEAHAYDNHRPSTPGTAINTAVEQQQVLRYVPDPGFRGVDEFTYSAIDNRGATGTARVQIAVGDASVGWQNPSNPLDVNDDGQVTTEDALEILARLNEGLTGWLPDTMVWPMTPPGYYDCDGSGSIEPLDALLVLNQVQSNHDGQSASGVASSWLEADVAESTSRAAVTDAVLASLSVAEDEEKKLRLFRLAP